MDAMDLHIRCFAAYFSSLLFPECRVDPVGSFDDTARILR